MAGEFTSGGVTAIVVSVLVDVLATASTIVRVLNRRQTGETLQRDDVCIIVGWVCETVSRAWNQSLTRSALLSGYDSQHRTRSVSREISGCATDTDCHKRSTGLFASTMSSRKKQRLWTWRSFFS